MLIEGDGDAMHCILTDFGLMKNVSAAAEPLTKAGSFLGSCDYAAPEQLLGERIDARVDVYALGCMLFQAVTGEVPFPRPVSAATMLAHMDEPPPVVSEHAPDAPRGARRRRPHGDGQGPGRALPDRGRARPRRAHSHSVLNTGLAWMSTVTQPARAGVLERVRGVRRRDHGGSPPRTTSVSSPSVNVASPSTITNTSSYG